MKIIKRSYELPSCVQVICPWKNVVKITYFTDCVFNPEEYNIEFKCVESEQTFSTIEEMDYRFIVEEIEKHPRILHNIGVINFIGEHQTERLGVLITKQSNKLYLSLIM